MENKRDCSKCGGTGQFLHFGTCFDCNGTGTARPRRQVKCTAWWTKECVCLNPAAENVFCSIHGFTATMEARQQLRQELAADAAYRSCSSKTSGRI